MWSVVSLSWVWFPVCLGFSTVINAVYVSYIAADSYVAATETEKMLNMLDWSRISGQSGTPLSLFSYTCTSYASLLNGHNTNKLVKERVERLRSLKPFSVSLPMRIKSCLPYATNPVAWWFMLQMEYASVAFTFYNYIREFFPLRL